MKVARVRDERTDEVHRTFTFDEMVEVHRYLENNGQFGKIVVTL